MRIVAARWELMRQEGLIYMRDLTGGLPTEVFRWMSLPQR